MPLKRKSMHPASRLAAIVLENEYPTPKMLYTAKSQSGSWASLATELGYNDKTVVVRAFTHPGRMSAKFAGRFREWVARHAEREGGYVTIITPQAIPNEFRILQGTTFIRCPHCDRPPFVQRHIKQKVCDNPVCRKTAKRLTDRLYHQRVRRCKR